MATTLGIDPNAPLSSATDTTTTIGALAGALGNAVGTATGNPSLGSASGVAPAVATAPSVLSAASFFGSLSWGRVAAFLIGLVALIIGLASLKQTQILVQPIIDTAKKAAAVGAVAA